MLPKYLFYNISTLKTLCIIIGFLHLITGVVDLVYYIIGTCAVTNGFQCEPYLENLDRLHPNYLNPLMFFSNLGNHGFYPYPPRFNYTDFIDIRVFFAKPNSQGLCYPGTFHVSIPVVAIIFINFIWMNLIKIYIDGVRKSNILHVKQFCQVCLLKLVLYLFVYAWRIIYLSEGNDVMIILALDIGIAASYIMIIYEYIVHLELQGKGNELPPTYTQCMGRANTISSASIANDGEETRTVSKDTQCIAAV